MKEVSKGKKSGRQAVRTVVGLFFYLPLEIDFINDFIASYVSDFGDQSFQGIVSLHSFRQKALIA